MRGGQPRAVSETVSGILLTGGRSRRFGADKTRATFQGRTLANIAAEALTSVAATAVEVGPGVTDLPATREDPPGGGPLAAVAAGWSELTRRGATSPVIVLAADLPLVTPPFVRWLAHHPSEVSVVPTADGRLQPLCARYTADAVSMASTVLAKGRSSMHALLDAIAFAVVTPDDWREVAPLNVLDDVDEPADLERLRATDPR